MPAMFSASVCDGGLNKAATATALHVVSGTPTTRAAVLAASLATVPLAPADFTLSDASPSGRRLTTAAKSGIVVAASGTPAHYCLVDGTELLARTEVDAASPDLVSGATTAIPAVPFEISGTPANL